MRFPNPFKRSSVNGGTTTVTPPPYVYYPQAHAESLFQSDLAISTVSRCVDVLAHAVATIPIAHERRQGEIYTPIDSDLAYLINDEPNDGYTGVELKETMVREFALAGNAYIVPRGIDRHGYPLELVICPRGSVLYYPNRLTYGIADYVNDIHEERASSELVHVHNVFGFPVQERRGMSILEHARQTLDIAFVAAAETKERFVNGGNVRLLVGNLSSASPGVTGMDRTKQIQELSDDYERKLAAGRKVLGLPHAIDAKQISATASDMQFLETRKFTTVEICRFFGVHPSMVYADTATNYKSAENSGLAFLRDTLEPLLCRIESEMTRKLIPSISRRRERLRFNRAVLHTMDSAGLVRYLTGMIQSGSMTINEARKMTGHAPISGGDRIFISANLKDINEFSNNETK